MLQLEDLHVPGNGVDNTLRADKEKTGLIQLDPNNSDVSRQNLTAPAFNVIPATPADSVQTLDTVVTPLPYGGRPSTVMPPLPQIQGNNMEEETVDKFPGGKSFPPFIDDKIRLSCYAGSALDSPIDLPSDLLDGRSVSPNFIRRISSSARDSNDDLSFHTHSSNALCPPRKKSSTVVPSDSRPSRSSRGAISLSTSFTSLVDSPYQFHTPIASPYSKSSHKESITSSSDNEAQTDEEKVIPPLSRMSSYAESDVVFDSEKHSTFSLRCSDQHSPSPSPIRYNERKVSNIDTREDANKLSKSEGDLTSQQHSLHSPAMRTKSDSNRCDKCDVEPSNSHDYFVKNFTPGESKPHDTVENPESISRSHSAMDKHESITKHCSSENELSESCDGVILVVDGKTSESDSVSGKNEGAESSKDVEPCESELSASVINKDRSNSVSLSEGIESKNQTASSTPKLESKASNAAFESQNHKKDSELDDMKPKHDKLTKNKLSQNLPPKSGEGCSLGAALRKKRRSLSSKSSDSSLPPSPRIHSRDRSGSRSPFLPETPPSKREMGTQTTLDKWNIDPNDGRRESNLNSDSPEKIEVIKYIP